MIFTRITQIYNLEELIIKKARSYDKNIIDITIADSETGKNKYLIQSHDCITYALGEHVMTGRTDRIELIGMISKEITDKGMVTNGSKLNISKK